MNSKFLGNLNRPSSGVELHLKEKSKEATCKYIAGNDDAGIDGVAKIAANVDLHALVPAHQLNYDTVARKFSLCRYTPAEWAEANQQLCEKSREVQLAALVKDRDSRWCEAECAKTSDLNQKSSTRLLSERAQQIRGVHADLAKVSWMCREEEEHLETQRQRVKRSISALTPPALINAECLERRTCRLERDLVNDDVAIELHKESALIDSSKRELQHLSSQIRAQLSRLRNARDLVEQDWSDKIRAGHLEAECLALSTANCHSARLCPSATRLPLQQVEPSQWEQFSKNNAALVEQEMGSSSKLRSETEQILTVAARQLRSQADSVENALERRIAEIHESRQSLEAQFNQILVRIVDTERLIADLRRASFNSGFPLRVAQQRLQIRRARPQPNENCSDPPQRGLLDEVRAVEEAAQELRARLQHAQTTLATLIETRGHLESEIRVKRHSLHVDELQCRDIRAKFPSTLDISG